MSRYNIAHKLGSKPRTDDVLLPDGESVHFSSMLLPQTILQGLHSAGFVKPSPIQLKAIPLARCGFDLIVQAKSGTGKTCVFAVTALEHVILTSNRLQAIVLAPTREIAQQIQHVISSVGCYLKSLKVKTFIGGVPLHEDKINLVNCQIAVGAPGRLRHLIEDGYLSTDAVRLVVLDEADKLMEETFQNDINFIFQKLPGSKQVIACSATYTQDLLNFLGNYMQSATHVTPGQDPSPILIGLKHFVCIQPASRNNLSKLKSKETCLLNILKNVSFIQCLVFSNYHSRAESICNALLRNGWTALWIAGKLNQTTRTAVMTNVKDLKVRILVTTDLTARGIDLHEVNLVINMDLPSDHQTYLHRMGRAGRYGGHGLVITIITEDEVHKFQRLLGAIEGSYASAYIIPDSKPCDSIWTNDVLKFEQIIGVTDDTAQNYGKDDDIDVDKGEKFSSSDDSDSVVENEDCKNENFIKLEDNALNEHNVHENVTSDHSYFGEGTSSIKIEGDIVDDSTKSNSIDHDNLSHDNNQIIKNSLVGNNDNVHNDKDPEKVSDSDDSESLNDNQNDDQIDSDIEYNDAISKFGLKLLNYTNNYTSNLSSYFDLDESLGNFIESKSQVDDNIPKKLLEPSGTVDFEYVSKFTEKLSFDMKKLLSITNDLDSEKIVTWLMDDITGDCLSKVFDNSKIKGNDNNKNMKEICDPEYYSQSSSSSMSSDDDNDDYDMDTNKKLLFSDKLPTKTNVRSVNKQIQMECKETESELGDNCIENSSRENFNENSRKDTEKKGNHEQMKELGNRKCEKTVLFLRKSKGDRKRKPTHNLSSSSSQSSNESKPNNRTTKEKIDSNKYLKKGKSIDITNKSIVEMCNKSDVCGIKKSEEFNKLQNPEKNQPSFGEKFSRISFKNNASCSKNYELDDDCDDEDDEDVEDGFDRNNENHQNSNVCANYYRGNLKEPQYYSASAKNNMNNMPNKVQEWYNLWYRQNANLRWYVGYNQYMNYMLNLKK